MTHTKDEALKLALEALINHEGNYELEKAGAARSRKAIAAIKQALAAPTAQEPVYREYQTLDGVWHMFANDDCHRNSKRNGQVLHGCASCQINQPGLRPHIKENDMKDSHLKTPRTLDECHFTPGYVSHDSKESLGERLAGYALAFVIDSAQSASGLSSGARPCLKFLP